MTRTPTVIDFLPRRAASLCATSLRRPRLLVRAARHGQAAWRRERDLPALLRGELPPHSPMPAPGGAVTWLRAAEGRLEEARRTDPGNYDLDRHIRLLIALLAEMRALSGADSRRPAEGIAAALPC